MSKKQNLERLLKTYITSPPVIVELVSDPPVGASVTIKNMGNGEVKITGDGNLARKK